MLLGFLKLLAFSAILLKYGVLSSNSTSANVRCIKREMDALLHFKTALGNNSGHFPWSSWDTNTDCCHWQGVLCSNKTNRVLKLHLPGDNSEVISGKISASLTELQSLIYLNLSFNYFEDGYIPQFFANLTNLRYLDLRACSLSNRNIPSQLGKLSQLQHLDLSSNSLRGSIPYQLGNLSQLQYLDLSGNFFVGAIPYQLGNLSQLQYLDLSRLPFESSFEGTIPYQLGNLSNLQKLILQFCQFVNGNIPSQLGSLSQLQYLDLSFSNLKGPIPYQFGNLSQLQFLNLSPNMLEGVIPYQLGNLSNLQELYLGAQGDLKIDIENTVGVHWLSRLTSLTHLELSHVTDLQYSHKWIQGIVKLPSLEVLYISNNNLSDKYILSLHSLKFNSSSSLSVFDLSGNNFVSSTIFSWISNMSSLRSLDLSNNQITGTLSDISTLTSLETFDISKNLLNGTISKDIRFPSSLRSLSLHSNSLKGVLNDYHFANLRNLEVLVLTGNSLALRFRHEWVPPFQLQQIYLRSCGLGPSFPKWLLTQKNVTELDISNAGIMGTIPKSFWEQLTPKLTYLNVSSNNISGMVPDVPTIFVENPSIILQNNHFEGPIPKFLRNASYLLLSNNKFSEIHPFLCASGATDIMITLLDVSNNQLSGNLPDCLGNFKELSFLDLSNNSVHGVIPPSIGSLQWLQVLILRNNRFIGELPATLKNCSNLKIFDLGENKLSGPIPAWIGIEVQDLKMLMLRNNNFSGSLSMHLCYLSSIWFFDMSLNNISGQIPKCFGNFTAMAEKNSSMDWSISEGFTEYFDFNYGEVNAFLMWKGIARHFKHKLYLKGIDLSSNKLTGEIPEELVTLGEMIVLNLSRNQLTGKIPSKIGQLTTLDSLDLSRNHLFGPIPSSLVQINMLSMLDLSYNNLSGKIPTGTQLQSFNSSAYEGNLDLCGEPLQKMCLEVGKHQELVDSQEDYESILSKEFYWSIAIGFIVGFWGIFGSILFILPWRHAYFRFLSNLSDTIYVMVTLNITKCNM